ncbi:MAG: hypothetical protein ACLSFZ_00650 [Frisingicoccus sp.]
MKWKLFEELVDTRLLAQMRMLIRNLSEEKDAGARFNGIVGKSLFGKSQKWRKWRRRMGSAIRAKS